MATYNVIVKNADVINPQHKIRNDEPEAVAWGIFQELMDVPAWDGWDHEKGTWADHVPSFYTKHFSNGGAAQLYAEMLARRFPYLHINVQADNGIPFQVRAGNRSTWREESPRYEHLPVER